MAYVRHMVAENDVLILAVRRVRRVWAYVENMVVGNYVLLKDVRVALNAEDDVICMEEKRSVPSKVVHHRIEGKDIVSVIEEAGNHA